MVRATFFAVFVGFFAMAAAYSKTAAADWAVQCAYGCTECPADTSCGCTLFTTHAMDHGSWGGGIVSVCNTLWGNFKAGKYAGWVKSAGNAIGKGDAVIMNNGHDGDASHCCVGTGSNLVSCHNPSHANVPPSNTWFSGGYINAVYTYSPTAYAEMVARNETSF